MSLAKTEELRQLQESVRHLLADQMPLTRVREIAAAGSGADPRLSALLADIGVPSLPVPEEYGGVGSGYAELVCVFEEFGRSLAPVPYLATLGLGVPALLASQDEEALRDYLPRVAAGDLTIALAWVEAGGDWDTPAATSASQAADGTWTVSGEKVYVLDGQSAGLLLVPARTGEGDALFAVDGAAAGLARAVTPTLDQTRPLARVTFADAPARLVGPRSGGQDILSAALDHAAVLLAAEMAGGAQACLDMSVQYAKIREQFGRPIGSFQAIKHKCAEIMVAVEGARGAVTYGGWAATESPAELPVVSVIAKLAAGEAYFRAAAENVQIHGGIGFTWEHDAHLYFKRAESSVLLFGDLSAFRRKLADRIGI
ncbi:MAG TPA: acyl-CoA dehydrogenase family protein [Trebonia sp.]